MGLFNFWKKNRTLPIQHEEQFFDGVLPSAELEKQFLARKKDKLIDLLVDFINNKAPLLIEDSEKLKVIDFEYDAPFEFRYGVYPDPNIISQEYWEEQFTVDCSVDGDDEAIHTILVAAGFKEDGLEWKHSATGKFLDSWTLFSSLEQNFFSDCWRSAKEQTKSSLRCFFFQHDVYRGIDADTGKPADSEDVLEILSAEGTQFVLMQ